MREILEISEADVTTGRWYSFDTHNLPKEKYYDTDKEPVYMYMFSQAIDNGDGTVDKFYWTENDLPYSVDTFRRAGGLRYWMAIPKI